MIRIFIILSLLGQLCSAQSALRFIHSKQRKEVEVPKLNIQIEVIEDLTYTSITAEFYHSAYSNQEAEMILPLPDGATITDYKLDVNGQMKDASVVLKGKALKAYEEIKARNVDPGIVEKKKNEYRIRVFPILHKKTKRMSISYVTRSKAVNGHYHYKLPIRLDDKVATLTAQIIAPNSKIESKRFRINLPGDTNAYRGKGFQDTISLKTPVIKENSVIIQRRSKGRSQATYYKTIIPDSVPLSKTYSPKKITLLWDSSHYLREDLFAKQIELLDQYFKLNPHTEIQLYSAGYELKELGKFRVKQGNWSKLKVAITQIKNEGALSLDCVKAIKKVDVSNPVFAMFDNARYRLFRWDIQPTVEIVVDLQDSTIATALDAMTHQKLRPLLDSDDLLGEFDSVKGSRILQFVCKGELPHQEINFGYEYESKPASKARFLDLAQQYKTRKPIVTATIAQHGLDLLTSQKQPSSVIADYAIEHRLVSDYTSMIVLETLRDYVKYEIPPRDPASLREYNTRIKQKQPRLGVDYRMKRKYHLQSHPWHGYPLTNAIKNINIWDRSLHRFFLKDQYDQKPHEKVMQWKNQAKSAQQSLRNAETQKQFINSANTIKKLDKERQTFYQIPSQYPKDKQVHVSLRGLVREPKTHVVKPGIDLREFVLAEDAPIVDVYRNSQRITYNLDSKHYKKTPLQAGDMIVITELNDYARYPYGFGGLQNEISNMPYIIDPGTNIGNYLYPEDLYSDGGSGDPFGDSDSLDGGSDYIAAPQPTLPKVATRVMIKGGNSRLNSPSNQPEIGPKQLNKFSEDIKKNPKAAYSTYLTLRSNIQRDTHFYLKVAEILYQQKLIQPARRVLSNIMAGDEAKTVAQKRYIYWLMHFGDDQHALAFIKIVDPELTNPDFKFIKIMILQKLGRLDKLSSEQTKKLTKALTHTFYSAQLAKKPAYDLRILASAESTGISRFIHVDHTPIKGTDLKLGSLSMHGLYSDIKDGIEELTMKRAIPGTYKIKLSNKVIATYRIEIHSRQHDGKISKNIVTIHTDGAGGWKEIDSINFNLP